MNMKFNDNMASSISSVDHSWCKNSSWTLCQLDMTCSWAARRNLDTEGLVSLSVYGPSWSPVRRARSLYCAVDTYAVRTHKSKNLRIPRASLSTWLRDQNQGTQVLPAETCSWAGVLLVARTLHATLASTAREPPHMSKFFFFYETTGDDRHTHLKWKAHIPIEMTLSFWTFMTHFHDPSSSARGGGICRPVLFFFLSLSNFVFFVSFWYF
jgi:hypothetical protein